MIKASKVLIIELSFLLRWLVLYDCPCDGRVRRHLWRNFVILTSFLIAATSTWISPFSVSALSTGSEKEVPVWDLTPSYLPFPSSSAFSILFRLPTVSLPPHYFPSQGKKFQFSDVLAHHPHQPDMTNLPHIPTF